VASQAKVSKTQEMVYELKVGDVMTKDVIAVHPERFMSELRYLLHSNRISGLPVVRRDKLIGMISVEDFIKWLADRLDDCPIGERMTGKLETLYDDDPLVLAVGKFEKSGLGRFPVVDRDQGKLVGILTKGDVIEGLLEKLEVDFQQEQIHRHRASYIFEDIEADTTTLLLHYRVKGQDFKQAGTASSQLKRTLKRLGVPPHLVRRIAIASYEAELNLVVFTPGGDIRARVQPHAIFVEVEDAGPGIADVDKALQPGFSTADEWVRKLGFGAGMGLTNIQKSSDSFDIQSQPGQGTRLKLAFFTEENHDKAS